MKGRKLSHLQLATSGRSTAYGHMIWLLNPRVGSLVLGLRMLVDNEYLRESLSQLGISGA